MAKTAKAIERFRTNKKTGERRSRGWYIQVYDTVTKERKWEKQTDEASAKRIAHGISEAARGHALMQSAAPSYPADAMLDAFLAVKMPILSPATYENYETQIRVHLKPALGSTDLATLDEAWVNTFVREQLLAENGLNKQNSIYQMLQPLGATYNWLIEKKQANLVNPVKGMRSRIKQIGDSWVPQSEPSAKDAWTQEEVARILAYLETHDPVMHLIFQTAISTGIRSGELRGLRWQNVHLPHSIRIEKNARKDGTLGPTKGKKERTVPLPGPLAQALAQHQESRHGRDGLTAPDRVFTKPTGEVWDYDSIANRFDALRAKMTLPEINARPFTFHSTRHTYASWALMANRPVIWVSKVLGHADIKTTLETYAHVIPDMAPDLSILVALETQNGGDSERVANRATFCDTITQPSVSPISQAIGSKGETWSGRRDLNPRPLDPQSKNEKP